MANRDLSGKTRLDRRVRGLDEQGNVQSTPTPGPPPEPLEQIDINTFQNSKFNVSGLTYPDNLMGSPEYGGNYVVFYISVHEDSKLAKDKKAPPIGQVAKRLRGPLDGQPASDKLVRNASAVAAGKAGYEIANRKLSGFLAPEVASAIAVVGGGFVGYEYQDTVVETLGGTQKEYKLLTKAIALHMPIDMSIRYNTSWEGTDLADVAAIVGGIDYVLGKNDKGIQGGVSYLTGLALRTPKAGDLLSKQTGAATNPKKEQLFREVDHRTFAFTYQFFPRSREEAAAVRNIIKEFKLHMHPEYRENTNDFLYIYPSEFDIRYYTNGQENKSLHRHTSCVLTELSVNYTPQGVFSSFEDGMPTQITVNMTFKELAILSKKEIEEGY